METIQVDQTGSTNSTLNYYFDLSRSGRQQSGVGPLLGRFHLCYVNTYPPMKEAIALPEGHSGYGFMMLGYPRFSYHRLPARKPPRIIWR